MEAVVCGPHLRAARKVRRALALLERIADARALGIEPADSSSRAAIAIENRLEAFLRQGSQKSAFETTLTKLLELAARLEDDGDC
jgi:flagellar biosynthesis/type III secretory pathway ATPase